MTRIRIREAVGVFSDYGDLQDTIKDLETSGFGRHQISVLGSEEARKEKLGSTSIPIQQLEDNVDAPRSANIGPEELGVFEGVLIGGGLLGGIIVALYSVQDLLLSVQSTSNFTVPILMAVLGGIAGGGIGILFSLLMEDGYRNFFKRQTEKGGMLLWIQTPDTKAERMARRIMEKHHAQDVHIHDIRLAA